jgi:hypothetical protein
VIMTKELIDQDHLTVGEGHRDSKRPTFGG